MQTYDRMVKYYRIVRSHFGSRPLGSSVSGPNLFSIILKLEYLKCLTVSLHEVGIVLLLELDHIEWYGAEGLMYLLKILYAPRFPTRPFSFDF